MSFIANDKSYFAVVDVETNWYNEVMSIGVVIADADEFNAVDKAYYVIYPECKVGGMYSDVLYDIDKSLVEDCSRKEAIDGIKRLLTQYGVKDVFAYNAPFDYKCLYELHNYVWRDILPIAANRNYNTKLPDNCEYFSTGLLKHGRGVQNVMRLIYWQGFTELHNGLQDALDELQLMQLINQPLEVYREYKPKQAVAPATNKRITNKPRETSHLSNYRYVVDELCGGSVRLIDYSRETKVTKSGDVTRTAYTYYLDLQCSRCGHKWTQEAEAFFANRKCPKC